MPREKRGQQITFAIERDEDQDFRSWIWVDVKRGDTVAKIAARRGHPEDARAIANANGIRSVNASFSGHKHGKHRVKVPGELRASLSFDVLAGDKPPKVTTGYAKLSTVDRPERVGLTTFDGYDPIGMDVPIRFEAPNGDRSGLDIERDIELLERMAGRGSFEGAATGPPPVIRVSTTGPAGEVVPLIPRNYQWSLQNRSGPLWRVADIDWDDDALRNVGGNRIRQLATVHLQQFTRLSLLTRSAAARAKAKPKKKAKK